MIQEPFYDPTKSYEENYEKGPFGAFADGTVLTDKGEPQHSFHGYSVNLPFGIPAGPLLNSAFVKAAFEKGYDICVYKTVRGDSYPCHPHPNVLSVKIDGDLTIEKASGQLLADDEYGEPLSITNSFGVPSKPAETWIEDVKRAVSYQGKGQIMVLSFMGTVKEGQSAQDFVDDHKRTAESAVKTGAKAFEVNLSCPNVGNEGLICYDLEMTQKICKAVREVLGKLPFSIKIGYFESDDQLKELASIADEFVDGIAGINTIPAEVVNEKGEQALPGKNRLKSGVCGHAIKWAGIETTERLVKIREENSYNFSIESMGGVTTVEDYFDYKKAGADVVMSATGAMWNPLLAQEIKNAVGG